MKYIQKRKERVIESELRCKESSDYLEKLQAPKSVWLSEDASGIVARVTYDPISKQLVGLVLPTQANTGIDVFLHSSVHIRDRKTNERKFDVNACISCAGSTNYE